jgi:hypothetical protein
MISFKKQSRTYSTPQNGHFRFHHHGINDGVGAIHKYDLYNRKTNTNAE